MHITLYDALILAVHVLEYLVAFKGILIDNKVAYLHNCFTILTLIYHRLVYHSNAKVDLVWVKYVLRLNVHVVFLAAWSLRNVDRIFITFLFFIRLDAVLGWLE